MWFSSDVDITESFWGSNFPNTDPANTDDCGVFVVDVANFWWEDTSCLAQEAHQKTVAIICQNDFGAEFSTTTTAAAGTTTEYTTATTTTIGTTTARTTTAATTTTRTTTAATTTTGTTPAIGCPSGWEEFRGHCYQLSINGLPWAEAEDDCKSKGGHLASIHSEAERLFIYSFPGADDIWIGASDSAVEAIFFPFFSFIFEVNLCVHVGMYTVLFGPLRN